MKKLKIIKESILVDETTNSSLFINKYTLSGICEEKTVYIQANVHGAELQGNLVIKELIEYFKQSHVELRAKIILVPLANPYGASVKIGTYTYGRFNPVTGDNWNRLYHNLANDINYDQFIEDNLNSSQQIININFKKLLKEKIQAVFKAHEAYGISDNKNLFAHLQSISVEADIIFDLHTGPCATRYLYAPEYLREKSVDTNSPHIITIPNEFAGAMDEASFYPWYKLAQKLSEKGITYNLNFEAYTVELGSEEVISSQEAFLDAMNLVNLLIKRGLVVDPKFKVENVSPIYCPLKNYVTYRAKTAGLCEYHKKPGASYKKGELLMSIHHFNFLEEDIDKNLHQVFALEDGIVINHTPSSNVKAGMDLLQCFKLSEK